MQGRARQFPFLLVTSRVFFLGGGGGQRGQPGLGLGWGSGLDMPAPLRVTRLTLSRACSVPAVAQMCPGAQPHLTQARPPQAHSWEATDEEVFFQRF